MRKTVTKSQKSKKIREQALAQLRKTREKLLKEHPLLMKKMAILAQRHVPHAEDETPKPAQDEVAVDKQKNMQVILKYLESKNGGDASPLNAAIKAILEKDKR